MENSKITAKIISKNGPYPNNEKLPLLIYHRALTVDSPKEIEKILEKNGWKRFWVNGIYPFHHYHSNTHELLAVVSGSCKIEIGGEKGTLFTIEKGDVLIIPVNVSHKNLSSSGDFVCVGAYPLDVPYDMNYGGSKDAPPKEIPLPETDPIYGREGPLFSYWKN